MIPNPNWRGDPTFLPEVLRLFGLEVEVLDGAFNRGHGDFGKIKGIVVHHIGSNKYDPWGIARHPSLGLCSQIHLARNGKVTICGVGIAYHAGRGSCEDWPVNAANAVSIGVEAESDGVSAWPKEELDAYYRLCAAILWFLGKRADRKTLISHWEYSRVAQGKWDPGAGNGKFGAVMDMEVFRARVNKIIDNPPFLPPKNTKGAGMAEAFDQITRKYRSRVEQSEFEGKPIDYLLNADRHAFYASVFAEEALKRLVALEEKVDALTKEAA